MVKKISYYLILVFICVQLIAYNSIQVAKADGTDIIIEKYGITNISTGKTITQVSKGQSFRLTLTLKNMTETTKTNVGISLGESSFYPSNTGSTKVINEITANSSQQIYFDLAYDGGTAVKIPITIDFTGSENKISTYVGINAVQEETSNTDTSKEAPNLVVLEDTMPQGNAGESIDVPVRIKNESDYAAKDITITPEFSDDNPFIMNSINRSQSISYMNSDEIDTVHLKLDIDPDAAEKVYSIKLNYKYYNYSGDFYGGTQHPINPDVIYIKVINKNSSSKLSIVQINSTPQIAVTGQRCQIDLKVNNIGSQALRDITFSLSGLKDDGFTLLEGTNQKNYTYISGGGEADIRYILIPSSKMAAGSYGLTLKMDYKNQSGKDISQEQQFFIAVQNSGGTGINGTPKIILSKYSCDPLIAKAGDNFKLNLSFLNTSKDKTVQNIKVYFTVNETTSSGGNVFTPVNSSNTFFIDSIAPKTTVSKTLDFFTIPDASPKTYTVTANFEYEDAEGKEYKSSELIGIPVSQQVKIDTSEITLPQECYAGQPFPLMLDFYNTGKVQLSNMMIRVEGDFDVQNGRYFVGNFEKGSSDHYEAMVTPKSTGEVKGALIMSYDEPTGQHMEVTKDFTLNVVEMPPQVPQDGMGDGKVPPEMKPQGKLSFIKKPIFFIPVIIVAAGITAFIIIKKRKKKGGMTLDE